MSEYNPSHHSHFMSRYDDGISDYREMDATWAKLDANAAITIVIFQIDEMLTDKFDSELQAMKYVLNAVSNTMMVREAFVYPPQTLLEALHKRSSEIYAERAVAGVGMVYFELAPWETVSLIFAMLKDNDVVELTNLEIMR